MQNIFNNNELHKEAATTIDGVRILFNKVVGDERGVFADLAEEGNPIFAEDLKHLHASIAIKKGVARGCHYHYRLKETFYILAGTGLCILHDFRRESPTAEKTYAVILGYARPQIETDLPVYTIMDGSLVELIIPPMVYHGFWPLTEEKLVLVGAGTHGYDPQDYARPDLKEVPGAEDILRRHNITL